MSLRGAFAATWQSPVRRDCFAIARNDMQMASLREPHKGVILQSATGEELSALLPSVLDRAFKGEL